MMINIPSFPKELMHPWPEDVKLRTGLEPGHKFLDRERVLRRDWNRLYEWIPEYLCKPNTILDISCGNGATLEILKYLGVESMGIDVRTKPRRYLEFIEHIPVQCILHDCSKVPYPIPDKSYDVVINYGSISCYGEPEEWHVFLDEFARIAKRCVLLGINYDPKLAEQKEKAVVDWIAANPKFELLRRSGSVFKMGRNRE